MSEYNKRIKNELSKREQKVLNKIVASIGASVWSMFDQNTKDIIFNAKMKEALTPHPDQVQQNKEFIEDLRKHIHFVRTYYPNRDIYDHNIDERDVKLTSSYLNEIEAYLNNVEPANIMPFQLYNTVRAIEKKLYNKIYYYNNKQKFINYVKNTNNNKSTESKDEKVTVNRLHDNFTFFDSNPNHMLIQTSAGIVKTPSLKSIYQFAEYHLEHLKAAHPNRPELQYSSLFCFLIANTALDTVVASTPKCSIVNMDGTLIDEKILLNNIQQNLEWIAQQSSGYSYLDTIVIKEIYVTTSCYTFKSLKQWKPLYTTNTTSKIGNFELYLNNTYINSKDCLTQTVEYFNNAYTKSIKQKKTRTTAITNTISKNNLKDLIPQPIVIYYYPKTGNFGDISNYNDLIHETVKGSNLITPDNIKCDDTQIARILFANEHVGIITKISAAKSKTKTVQKRKPKQTNKQSDAISVFLDIEAFQQPTQTQPKNNNNNSCVYLQVPYLLCASTDKNDKVDTYVGEDCCQQFCKHLLSHTNTNFILYAWYGSGYDYHHILKHLLNPCYSRKFIIKGNKFIGVTLYFKKQNVTLTFKDPYLFILTSLSKASKAFNVTTKSEFPHDVIKSFDDLNTKLKYWYKNKKVYTETLQSDNNNNMLVSSNLVRQYEDKPNNLTNLEQATEYCMTDVIALKEIWMKFNKLLSTSFDVEINELTYTLSQLSMSILERNLPKNIQLHIPTTQQYNFMKNAIYGGRVISKNGIYKEDILYADVVSLYPSAMKLEEHSYGPPTSVTEINWSQHGIYNVTLTSKYDSEPENYQPFIPRRLENQGLSWKWFKQHTGTYHTYDLLIAKDQGYTIKCINGIEFPKKGYILSDFVTKLFDIKNEHSSCSCPEQPCPIRMIAKIALNGGGYGKFVQKPITKEVHIVERDIVAGIYHDIANTKLKEHEQSNTLNTHIHSNSNDQNHDHNHEYNNVKINIGEGNSISEPQFFNLDGYLYDKMIIDKDDKPRFATQVGISILSASRYRLYKLCKQFPNMNVIYSDTDSIFVTRNSVDPEAFNAICNTDLGNLDNTIENSKNNSISSMYIVGPKTYCYTYIDKNDKEQEVYHSKGVYTGILSLKQFEHLASHPNHTVYYETESMRKKLVNIETIENIKKIRQT